MSRAAAVVAALLVITAGVTAQLRLKGTVTFISGDVYYTSLGRTAGVPDSAFVYVMAGRDTTAVLRIFALSSRSSACRLAGGGKTPKVGDSVAVWVETPAAPPGGGGGAAAAASAGSDTAAPARDAVPASVAKGERIVQGRVALQYRTYFYGGTNADITQPSVAIALRGAVPGSPIRFELQGNLRSTVFGSQDPFSASGINQSRIYRLAVEYDDGTNRAAVGRMLAGALSSAGYIDGIALQRRLGPVSVGGAFGYEPDFSQRSFTTDRRKFTLFTNLDPAAGLPVSAGLAYTRSFFGTSLDRDIVSGNASYAASPELFFAGQAEVDLHAWQNGEIRSKPKLTSVVANGSYRAWSGLTLSAGVTAWRAVFPLSVVAGIPDSLLDRTLWASPSIGLSYYPQAGIFVQETYSPRTSPDGFAREFYNSASAGAWNILDQGTNLRATWTTNASRGTRTQGYALSADQHLAAFADLTLRWQYYGYTFTALDERAASRSVGADLTLRFLRQFTFWTSYEFASGFSGDYTHIAADLSWRF